MISLQNVSKRYGRDVVALTNVSFDIRQGEFLFLTGKSGSGKSTLFKMLYKDELPSEGNIDIFDKSLRKIKTKNLRRKMGVVFQDYKLLNNKTVYENVSYPLSCLGVNPFIVKEETMRVLKMMGIEQLYRKKPEELSGGEQQRVAIARAIVNKPIILLCDEPTGNLDSENTWIIMKHLQELNDSGTTIVMTTHSEEIVQTMKKRVIVLDKGELISDIKPEDLEDEKVNMYALSEAERNKLEILKGIGWKKEEKKYAERRK
ncbi:cell division ATP-binding protein FtsE [Bacillus thuringiensis]|uniref:cell division ATP-binding protein FtsE n=1 Tax=Bacillus thuringiensis TaxID=1428 RepID=UPI0021D69A9A|nr:ATP-binding cassette domain-containing protein [Bacillus thuringiensis]MCU7667045.1 ATP-binding cassette domain-containing protein [Bacillus thuringiensis]